MVRRSNTAPLPVVEDAAPPVPIRSTRSTTVLFGLGLVVVTIVSGVIWWGIRTDHRVTGQPEPAQGREDLLTSGEFEYAEVTGVHTATDCAANSYGEIEDWFSEYPCEQLARGLFITQVDEARVLVSVSAVSMPEPHTAQQLKIVADTDGTGNVADLIRDGTAQLPEAPNVAGGAYDSAVEGTEVTIVESAFFGGHENPDLLEQISTDAVRLGKALR